jgi:hypothetical protein
MEHLWEALSDAVRQKNWEASLRTLQSICAAKKATPAIYLRIGDVFHLLHKDSEALSAYREAAYMYEQQGLEKKALAVYEIILAIDGDDQEAREHSSALLLSLGEEAFDLPCHMPERSEAAGDIPRGDGMADGRQPDLTPPPSPGAPDAGYHSPVIFSCLSAEQNRRLLLQGTILHFPKGKTIIDEGEGGDSLYSVLAGRVKVIAHIQGRCVRLATLGEGDVFGEIAFLTGRPRTASVITEDNSTVVELKKTVLENAIHAHPPILEEILEFFTERTAAPASS